MKNVNVIKTFLFSILTVLLASSYGCSYYHEPAFKGTILDYDTKQPIEGAVVVVEYKRSSSFLAPHSTSSIMDVRETLTNKEGHFAVSSYTTLMAPIYEQIPSFLIIFKPGYASLEVRADYFTGDEVKEEKEGSWYWAKDLRYRIHGHGILEIPRLNSREDRLRAEEIGITDYHSKDLPLLYRALNEEEKYLNIPERR